MMRSAAFLTALLASPLICFSADFHSYIPLGPQQVSAIISTETRTVIDLSGPWQRVEDGEVVGTVQLPGSLSASGAITVRRTIKIDQAMIKSRSWHLLFLGVSDEVRLRVNNRDLTRHPGGTSPFAASINDRMLVQGNNVIELTIGPSGALSGLTRRFAPAAPKAWTGITRELFLVGTPQVWTSEVTTSTAFSSRYSSASVVAKATIRSANVDQLLGIVGSESMRQDAIDVTVDATLRNTATGEVVARSSASTVRIERSRTVQASLDLYVPNPRLWSPAQPNLYKLEIQCSYNGKVIDTYQANLGLRSLRIAPRNKERWIVLNDQPMFVYGIDYVEEYPRVGPSMSWRQMEHDVAMLKTLGVNVLRFEHGAPHPYLLHLCDVYGIMVMAEVDAAAIPTALLEEEEVAAQLRNRADLLGTYVGSHPSLLACGLSEGLEEGSPITQKFHQQLSRILRGHVTAPLYKVVSASQMKQVSEGGFDLVIAQITNPVDRKHIADILKDAHNAVRTAALVAQIGSVISPGNSNGFSDPLSVESQAVNIRDGLQATRAAGIAGIVVHSFSDYTLAQPTMLVEQQDPYQHVSGLVDVWRQPRVAYEMYKSLINDEKEPLLQAREVSGSTSMVFVITGLLLALLLTVLINRSRRFREYFLRAVIRPYNFYADIRDQRILSAPQTAMLGLVIAISAGLVLAASLYYLRTDPRMEYLLHIVVPFDGLYNMLRLVAWRPAISVGVFGLVVFSVMLLAAGVLRVGAMFVKGKIFYRDTLTIVVWSSVPLLALLPIGVALYQVLATDTMGTWIPLVTLIAIVWSVLRTLRATSVVFDAPPLVVHGIGIGFILVAATIVAVVWGMRFEAHHFLSYYNSVIAV